MTFGDIASLAIAYSDLQVVTDVVNAINANLPKTGPLGTIPAATRALDPRPRLRSTPERQFGPREVSRPQSQVAAVRHADVRVDRFEPCGQRPPIIQTVVVEAHNRTHSPFLPPWATLPPVPHVTAVRVVKVIHQKVDLVGRGMLLDIFV